MTFLNPFFFLLLDSWLGSACELELGPFAAAWVEVESLLFVAPPPEASEAVDEPEAAEEPGAVEEPDWAPSAPLVAAAGVAESLLAAAPFVEAPAGGGNDSGPPGVIVSTAAVLPAPTLEGAAVAVFGCNAIPSVSSPDSLAGVMVGSPLLAAMDTSGEFFRTPIVRLIRFG